MQTQTPKKTVNFETVMAFPKPTVAPPILQAFTSLAEIENPVQGSLEGGKGILMSGLVTSCEMDDALTPVISTVAEEMAAAAAQNTDLGGEYGSDESSTTSATVDTPTVDVDAATVDAATADVAAVDTTTIDAGTVDVDTATVDADTATVDAAAVDTATVDVATVDTTTVGTATVDAPTVDTATIDAATVDVTSGNAEAHSDETVERYDKGNEEDDPTSLDYEKIISEVQTLMDEGSKFIMITKDINGTIKGEKGKGYEDECSKEEVKVECFGSFVPAEQGQDKEFQETVPSTTLLSQSSPSSEVVSEVNEVENVPASASADSASLTIGPFPPLLPPKMVPTPPGPPPKLDPSILPPLLPCVAPPPLPPKVPLAPKKRTHLFRRKIQKAPPKEENVDLAELVAKILSVSLEVAEVVSELKKESGSFSRQTSVSTPLTGTPEGAGAVYMKAMKPLQFGEGKKSCNILCHL